MTGENIILDLDFYRARFKSFWNELVGLLGGRFNRLLSFEEIRSKFKIYNERYEGIKKVEINKIIGSFNRYNDFDGAFLPRHSHIKEKWEQIDKAFYKRLPLPPVKLYKIGDAYFVFDGHNRISVAKEKGEQYVEAEVIQCKTKLPLLNILEPKDLEIQEEYLEFLENTQLHKLHPEVKIEFSLPGSYDALLEHIYVHRYYLGIEQNREVPWDEAVSSWYDNVFTPIISIVRKHNILNYFPQKTEADIYLWLIERIYYLKQQYGEDIDQEEASLKLIKEELPEKT